MSHLSVDDREPVSDADELVSRGVPAKRERLEVGDFAWWDSEGKPALVSRKMSDLLPSIFSNHFQEELTKCHNYLESAGGGHLIVLLEGVWAPEKGGQVGYYQKKGKWFRQTQSHYASPRILAGLETSLYLSGVGVVHTADHEATLDQLALLYERSQEGWPSGFLNGRRLPPLKKSTNPKVAKLMMLCPRLPEKVAMRLLNEFGSIGCIVDFARNSPEVLTQVKGFGRTMLKNLQESIS